MKARGLWIPLVAVALVASTAGLIAQTFTDGSPIQPSNVTPDTTFSGPRGVQEFAEVGEHTWVAPPRVYRVMLELWGGSGGGGGGGGGSYAPGCGPTGVEYGCGGGGGGGGGAGGYLRTVVNVTPGETYILRIGSGGDGGSGGAIDGAGDDGQPGTASEFEGPGPVILASAAAGGPGLGGDPGGGSGGAGGAGGGVDPVEGIMRAGTDGTSGFASDPAYYFGGIPGILGRTACGSVSPPQATALLKDTLTGGFGGYGGHGETGNPPEPGTDGQPGDTGFAVLHW